MPAVQDCNTDTSRLAKNSGPPACCAQAFQTSYSPRASGNGKSGAMIAGFQCSLRDPQAANSISARTVASRISGDTCAMNFERKASSSALSRIAGSSLDLGDAAIDVKLDSRDVTRFIRCKEGNSFGDLIRISQSAERNVVG